MEFCQPDTGNPSPVIAPSPFKRYGVVGHPIEHSRSPFIHAEFARQTGIALRYEKILAPLDGFAEVVQRYFAAGGAGLNITVPFKAEAWKLARQDLSPRARMAGAVNTLWMHEDRLHGCNTDGIGLLRDLERLGHAPAGRRILLVGAGGAARGVVLPLMEAGCAALRIINRSPARALDLRAHVLSQMPELETRLQAGSLDEAGGPWDIVVNATSSSLGDTPPALPQGLYAPRALAYDMVYAAEATPFMRQAQAMGASHTADGLGMLVGQAAASFAIWHGVVPEMENVLRQLRQNLASGHG